MSEESDGQQAGDQQDFKPITSQEEFERALGRRLDRERAKFADYDDLKAKASKFDEVEEKSKTELQKAQERAAELEKRATQAEKSALQVRIAAELGVPQEAVHGDDEEAMRASAQRLVEWRDANRKPNPKAKTLASGSSGEPKSGEKGRAAAALRAMRQG